VREFLYKFFDRTITLIHLFLKMVRKKRIFKFPTSSDDEDDVNILPPMPPVVSEVNETEINGHAANPNAGCGPASASQVSSQHGHAANPNAGCGPALASQVSSQHGHAANPNAGCGPASAPSATPQFGHAANPYAGCGPKTRPMPPPTIFSRRPKALVPLSTALASQVSSQHGHAANPNAGCGPALASQVSSQHGHAANPNAGCGPASASQVSSSPPRKKARLDDQASNKSMVLVQEAETFSLSKPNTSTHAKPLVEPPKSETYTVVTGLRGFLKHDGPNANPRARDVLFNNMRVDREAMLRVIEDDNLIVTALMFEYSLYLHFLFARFVEDNGYGFNDFFTSLNVVSFRNFLFSLQRKVNSRGRVYEQIDPEYLAIRNSLTRAESLPQVYDTSNRAAIFQEQIDTFIVSFKNSLTLNAPKLIERFFRKVPDAAGDLLERGTAKARVRLLLNEPFDVDERLGVSFRELKENPYKYIPFFYRLQRLFNEANVRSFHVVPRNKAQPRFVLYTNTALSELIARYCVETGQRAPLQKARRAMGNKRRFWSLFFDIERFESDEGNKKFSALMTNGVQANVIMKRTAEPAKEHQLLQIGRANHKFDIWQGKHKELPPYDLLMANDPGKRLVIGGIIAEQATGKVKEVRISAKEYNHATGYCERKVKMEEWSGHLEGIIRKRREALQNIGPSSADFRTYVRFELGILKRKVCLYSEKKFRHLRFDMYIRRRKFIDNFVASLCPRDKTMVLFNGSAKFGPCIKG
jgi:hypothetical protein